MRDHPDVIARPVRARLAGSGPGRHEETAGRSDWSASRSEVLAGLALQPHAALWEIYRCITGPAPDRMSFWPAPTLVPPDRLSEEAAARSPDQLRWSHRWRWARLLSRSSSLACPACPEESGFGESA